MFVNTPELIRHLHRAHNIQLEVENQTFPGWKDFLTWKAEVERMTKSYFVQHRAGRWTKSHKTSWFYCNRTGKYVSKGDGKRAVKSQGSCKTGGSCTAYITARTDASTGQVVADYCLKHVGHKMEISFTRMSNEMRSIIAGKLAQGVNMNTILDFIRDSQIGPLSRDHLTTRKDIHNIKDHYNIDHVKKDAEDAKSVAYWVAEMERDSYNSVLCYKAQGEDSAHSELGNKDFFLGIQTEFQKHMFQKYAHKVICADATHGTTAYDFQLITVMVADDYDEGIPVAWLISNRESENVLKHFFTSIRERCGEVKTDVFMSDDANAYYNAWAATFPQPSKKLLCSWHVDRSWRRKLNEHIKDREAVAEVYAAMKRIQNEVNEAAFRRSMQQFIAWVTTLSSSFAQYFQKQYAGRTKEWASCFRVGSRINTNMFLESFHRTLKQVYLERKQNRRVDHLLHKLLKISRDKAYEQWIKAEKGKVTMRQRESSKRHRRAECIPKQAICEVQEGCWEVGSTTEEGKIHHVQRTSSESCPCSLRCQACHACVHTFQCSCLDFAVRGLLCIHIHAVNITKPQGHITEMPDEQKEERRKDLGNLIPLHNDRDSCPVDVAELKRKVLREIGELNDTIQQAPNGDTLHAALRHIHSALAVARGLTVIGNDHHYIQTRTIPANKHCENQKRFFSTKCKRKIKRPRISLSDKTAAEIDFTEPEICGFCFKEIPPGYNGETVDWVECSLCRVWVHTNCDHVDDLNDYVCSMCR